jgi:peptidyl-prolyl cis-trans isomerase SurA
MIKKIILTNFLILSLFFVNISTASISIIVNVDDQIVTSHDLKKESDYLKILNPNLSKLNNNQILELAKNSLINEIIKKKEISKFINTKEENSFLQQYLKNLYSKLSFDNEEEFQVFLKEKNSFTLDEIKEKIKVELFWNELIYSKYKGQIKIDRKAIIKKVDNFDNNKQKEYFLSEIAFVKKKDLSMKNLINQIKLSIDEIGFNNTANVYSIADSSKLGGKLGWVNESSLSKVILEKIKLIDEGSHTDVIRLGNSYLILQIDQIRINEVKIDKKKEVEKLIQAESNKQLNQFSKIYFDKSKINYSINEK